MGVPGNTIISMVDDDESFRDAIKSLLKSIGFKVEVFAVGDAVTTWNVGGRDGVPYRKVTGQLDGINQT